MHVIKLAVLATAAVTATGSIALAASQSTGPSTAGHALPTNAATQAQQHAGPALSARGKHGGHGPRSAHAAAHGSPHPNLDGLCHAWLAGAGAKHGKARSNPAFSYLVSTAGGVADVASFCTARLAAKPHSGSESEAPDPSDSADPSDAPESRGAPSHPHGKPAGVPSHPNATGHS